MPLNKLDNFIKNTEGRILYVSPSDLDSTDSVSNQGNSLTQPFKTLQRALIESARFSYLKGNSNDIVEKTTILLMPGEHIVDNRPGFAVKNDGGIAKAISPGGGESAASDTLTLQLNSNFDLEQEDNILYKFNSVNGGVVVPRGTSIVGLDLRKTKIKPKYVPNPTDPSVANSAIFRITGACYFWQFSIFDGDDSGLVYTDPTDFSAGNRVIPLFSHHKLTVFEYADGVNNVNDYDLTDLDMYYAKLSNAYNIASGRNIDDKYPAAPEGFEKQRPEWEIVGAFASDPILLESIESGSGGTPSTIVTVTTKKNHNLTAGTPIKIENVSPQEYNLSTKVQSVSTDNPKVFTYLLPSFSKNLVTPASVNTFEGKAQVTIETDTVSGASPYIFNCSLRSVYGMNGMWADGSKASGFKSMVVAQFTGISLQKDDRSFVKYNSSNRTYVGLDETKVTGSTLSNNSASRNSATVYHLDSGAVYRQGWETTHIKITDDAILQIVSVFAIGYNKHFAAESGGDASITNSNSNFGQLSLISDGFKKESFSKDNKAFITNIVAPKAITSDEENIDWLSVDVGVTTSVSNNKRLYLYGYSDVDIVPPILTQGYRVGAKVHDKVYVDFSAVTGYATSEAKILMTDNSSSSFKEYPVISGPTSNRFSLNSHNLSTGEKVIVISDDGDYPENIKGETVYYVIDEGDDNHIRLASSKTDADNYTNLGSGDITAYGGTKLKIISRISDKIAGDIGHPVQFDDTSTVKQWYITTNTGNDVYNALTQIGVKTDSGLDAFTEPSFIKRKADSRSLDDKIFKLRVVIPQQLTNSKNPESGFIIQESSTTGVRTDGDFSTSTISATDYEYNRNPRFISTCSFTSGSPTSTISVTSELPHNLNVGDQIIVKNVTDSTNPVGTASSGYNGTYTVDTVTNDMQFTYETTKTLGSSLTNNTSSRTTDLPRFERNDLQSNLYVYRNETIQNYVSGQQDGIYHLYTLSADVGIATEFTNLKYSQNVVDLYPQLDRDNIDDNPESAESYALRSPLGEVATSNLKKSITKSSTNNLIKTFNNKFTVANESTLSVVAGIATLTFTREHGLSGIATYTGSITGGSGHTNGTFYNVKLFNEVGLSSWNGATATVGVSGGAVVSVDIQSAGSGYQSGATLYLDTAVIGGSANATITIDNTGLTGSIISTGAGVLDNGGSIQVTGIGTTTTGYYRLLSIPAKNQIAIAKTAGDPISVSGQYVLPTGGVGIVTSNSYDSATGITNVVCSYAHGLVSGNRLRFTDSNNNQIGDYLVKSRVGVNTFTVVTNASISPKYIIKHGLSANDGISDKTEENIAARGVSLYDNEIITFEGFPDPTDNTKIQISSPTKSIGLTKRLPVGSYLQIDNEIMRIASDTLTGVGNSQITVLRGVLGTGVQTHDAGSFAQKVKPLSIEFRRPSILRASGHTFEYLGYGPGNYSTGLPQVQVKSLTEREEFLSQSQERGAGAVVYTGMNNRGDFYIGNKRVTSSTGEETTFDAPTPTVTGQDPARLSVVFDEVTIKERLTVEGGDSKQLLTQFDGPVTFNNEIVTKEKASFKKSVKINDTTDSTTATTGALVVKGGVGIGANLTVDGTTLLKGNVDLGDAATDTVSFVADVDTTILPSTDGTLDLGASGSKWGNIYGVLASLTDITVSGGANLTGVVTATTFSGSGANLTSLPVQVTISNNADNRIITGGSGVNLNGESTLTYDGTNLDLGDDNTISLGDAVTFHDNGGQFHLKTGYFNVKTKVGEDMIIANNNDSVKLFFDNVATFETISGGAKVTGELQVTDDITAYYSSDKRLKDNIKPIEDPLAKILSISGNTFDWNSASGKEGSDTGVIAQEVDALNLPGITTIRDDGTYAVRYERLVPVLIEAIKELSAKVDNLEQKLSDK